LNPVRVLLADDHIVVRQGLRRILETQSDIEIVAETGSGLEACKLAGQLKPDIAVLDIAMKELSGIDATSRVMRYSAKTSVLILSMYGDERYVMAAIKAGARGYLLKDSVEEEIILAIRNLYVGRSFFSPALIRVVLERSVSLRNTGQEDPFAMLTDRERQVYQLLKEGNDDREVAARLRLSLHTIEEHRKEIMRKLDLRGCAQLILSSFQAGQSSL
jgi:DNA-binding NarL/FixJ family response regulator